MSDPISRPVIISRPSAVGVGRLHCPSRHRGLTGCNSTILNHSCNLTLLFSKNSGRNLAVSRDETKNGRRVSARQHPLPHPSPLPQPSPFPFTLHSDSQSTFLFGKLGTTLLPNSGHPFLTPSFSAQNSENLFRSRMIPPVSSTPISRS